MTKHNDKHDPSDPPARPGRNRFPEDPVETAAPIDAPAANAYAPGIDKLSPDADGNVTVLVCSGAGATDHAAHIIHQRDLDGAKANIGGVSYEHVDTLPDGRWRYARS